MNGRRKVVTRETEVERSPFSVEGLKVLTDEPLAKYTSARMGGPADWLVIVDQREALVETVRAAQSQGIPWFVLGSGSNVLVSEAGVRGLVIINKARRVVFREKGVHAESGANLSSLARNCIGRGLAGLEWAVNVPGTVGGAVVGNAGAHDGDIASILTSATLLDREGTIGKWSVEDLDYEYRGSILKRAEQSSRSVVLAADLKLTPGKAAELSERANRFVAQRKKRQPPGASIGSMFKNPAGDYAGRLIEAAGLKGTRRGDMQISPIHANFFVNTGQATAADVKALIDLARERVQQRFGIALELEVELVGEW